VREIENAKQEIAFPVQEFKNYCGNSLFLVSNRACYAGTHFSRLGIRNAVREFTFPEQEIKIAAREMTFPVSLFKMRRGNSHFLLGNRASYTGNGFSCLAFENCCVRIPQAVREFAFPVRHF
jgi:hypothetical protein